MSKKVVQKIILGAVITREGKVLIIQRASNEDVYPNLWELPSGKRKELETSENSLLREVREETGLDINIIRPFSVFDYQIEKIDQIVDSTQINFLATLTKHNEDVLLSNEHQSYKWITLKEIDNYDITDSTKNVIRKALEIA